MTSHKLEMIPHVFAGLNWLHSLAGIIETYSIIIM